MLVVASWLLPAAASVLPAQDDGWIIDRMNVEIDIRADGTLQVNERIDVDFRNLQRRGIFREIERRFEYGANQVREYDVRLLSATSPDGSRYQVLATDAGPTRTFRIGDPDRTLTGKQSYNLTFTIGGALNAFPGHDELYWNVTGDWPVPIQSITIVVTAPDSAIERVDCFQGPRGSTERCTTELTPARATFTATRPLRVGEQLTIVAGLRKGVFPEPAPILVGRPRTGSEYFEPRPEVIIAAAILFIGLLSGMIRTWWRVGRDRRYATLYRSATDTIEETVPLFGARPIAVEFKPPDAIRPGQMGLLLDERADTLDITATIIDLAVRGHLRIIEIPKSWIFGSRDWQLNRLKDSHDGLLEYERIVMKGLFNSMHTNRISALKDKFHEHLKDAKTALYNDAVAHRWFPLHPATVRARTLAVALVMVGAGFGIAFFLGSRWGAGLIGMPFVAAGLLAALFSGAMPRLTGSGRNLLERSLGFGKYLRTAETHQHEFAERSQIFTENLPYAIIFKCVDRWARAFKDIDMQSAAAAWYVGSSHFDVGNFSSTLTTFSSSMSAAAASTPGSSGGSGFGGGGSSGGGGGGGGGGSW
jgi:uncharacterized membrane protein YgcG